MSEVVIHHGTPLTPRDALLSVCAGRAMCVSFFRPDDVEVVEAISPAIMFRQWRVFVLDAGDALRPRMGTRSGLVAIFRVAGIALVSPRKVGGHTGQPRRTIPAQRRTAERVAFRQIKGGSPLAHGRPDREARQAMRALRSGRTWLGRAPEEGAGWLRCLPGTDGRCRHPNGEYMAPCPYDARDRRCLRLPFYKRGQHQPGTERMAI